MEHRLKTPRPAVTPMLAHPVRREIRYASLRHALKNLAHVPENVRSAIFSRRSLIGLRPLS